MSSEKHHSVWQLHNKSCGSPGHLGEVLELPEKHADISVSGLDERN